MKLQYVFGNPTSAKKKRRKSVAKKNPQRTKVVAKRKVRKKIKSGPNKGKMKTTLKTVQTRKGKVTASKGDLHKLRSGLSELRSVIAYARGMKKGASAAQKKKLTDTVKKAQDQYKTANDMYKGIRAFRKEELKHIKNLVSDIKAAGMVAETEKKEWKLAKKKKASRKKASRKKATRKKSAAKKKTTRRKSAAKKKTTRRKSASKKKTTRRKSASKKKSTRKKSASKKKSTRRKSASKKKTRRKSASKKRHPSRASVTVYAPKSKKRKRRKVRVSVKANPKRKRNPFKGLMKKGNPMKVAGMQVAGYDAMELAELSVGGLLYGAANSYISPMFAKIPGVGQYANALGGTLPSLMAGVALNIASDKVQNRQVKQALNFLGDGLLGAAVVGAGVHLSQNLLPAPGMSGVDYIPQGGKQDFGGVDYTPEMSGVDYTPEMSGVDYVPGANQPGANEYADFGEYVESEADFGLIPEGMN